MRNIINLYFYKYLGKSQLLNDIVRFFYNSIFLVLLIRYLKIRFSNICSVEKRHSLIHKEHFNAFLSDIDLTVVIKNNSSSKEILLFFLKIRKFFIMLDIPEVYEESDYATYKLIKESSYWSTIYTLWCIRKINWNYKSLAADASELNRIKKQRAIEISLNKILVDPSFKSKVYSINDFKFLCTLDLLDLAPHPTGERPYFSHFLETDQSCGCGILLTIPNNKYLNFNGLMPCEEYTGTNKELKNYITFYEILITKASLRIDEALSVNNIAKHEWIAKLERSFP